MTPTEATTIANLLCQMWPYPELDETGLEMLVIAMADTGLSIDEAKRGIRALMQQDHRFRPQPINLTQAAKPPKYAAAYHRPFDELPPKPQPFTPEPMTPEQLAQMKIALTHTLKRVEPLTTTDQQTGPK